MSIMIWESQKKKNLMLLAASGDSRLKRQYKTDTEGTDITRSAHEVAALESQNDTEV